MSQRFSIMMGSQAEIALASGRVLVFDILTLRIPFMECVGWYHPLSTHFYRGTYSIYFINITRIDSKLVRQNVKGITLLMFHIP